MSLYDRRVGTSQAIRMLDLDLVALLDCVHANSLFGSGIGLDESSDGGIVIFASVDGPLSAGLNPYGVRIRNATELKSSAVTAPRPLGVTIATDQALYVEGDFNKDNRIPAALIADSLNVLSASWLDAASCPSCPFSSRVASSTVIHAALLAGTDSTGGAEGAAGRDGGDYNGGLENFVRLHENWSGRTLTIEGSFASLGVPQHVNGTFAIGSPRFTAPNRAFGFDPSFSALSGLPPATPRMTYLRVASNVRRFDL